MDTFVKLGHFSDTSNVSDVVTQDVCDDCRVARIVFGNVARSAPTSAALVWILPATRAKRAMEDAPKPNPVSASMVSATFSDTSGVVSNRPIGVGGKDDAKGREHAHSRNSDNVGTGQVVGGQDCGNVKRVGGRAKIPSINSQQSRLPRSGTQISSIDPIILASFDATNFKDRD